VTAMSRTRSPPDLIKSLQFSSNLVTRFPLVFFPVVSKLQGVFTEKTIKHKKLFCKLPQLRILVRIIVNENRIMRGHLLSATIAVLAEKCVHDPVRKARASQSVTQDPKPHQTRRSEYLAGIDPRYEIIQILYILIW
jgi:hypothetical protein